MKSSNKTFFRSVSRMTQIREQHVQPEFVKKFQSVNSFSVNLHLRLNYGLQNMFIAGHFPCVHCGLMPVGVPVETPEK